MTLRAVVLLGGIGTRLRPLTLTTPKQALPIAEVPMIERVLAHLADHGVASVVLSLGYRYQAFAELFPDGRFGSLEVGFAVEPEPLDTGGAIRFAALAAGIDERFVVVNGDILTDLDVSGMVEFHRSRESAKATVALAHVADSSAFGLVVTDPADGRVEAFLEKPPPEKAGPGLVNAGTYVLEASVLDLVAEGRKVSVEREVFPALAAERSLFGYPSRAYWTDTGTPRQYLQAQLDLVAGRRGGLPAPGAVDDGSGVWRMGESTVLGVTRAPVLLGRACVVRPRAVVSNAVVGSGAHVGDGAVVEGSVLLPGARVDEGAQVRDSIVGPGAVVGAGAAVAGGSVIAGGTVIEPGAALDGARVPEPAAI